MITEEDTQVVVTVGENVLYLGLRKSSAFLELDNERENIAISKPQTGDKRRRGQEN